MPQGGSSDRNRDSDQSSEPAASALIDALAKYLGPAHDKADVRHAINVWRHDVVNAGLQPERILIDFKNILRGVMPPRTSLAMDHWEEDRREMIVMCIEEYFASESRGAP